MRIEAVVLREIRMPLVHFFETSFGRTTSRRILLVELKAEGITGWGECVAGEHPYYSEESIDTAWHVLEHELGPAVAGRNISSGREVPPMLARVREHRMAKAALENAVWDAEAQAKQTPLWLLLGGTREKIPCGVSIGIQDSLAQLLDRIDTELRAGYRRIKLKCKPGWDLNVFEAVRNRWPDITLSCDANSAYTLSDRAHLKEFDRFRLLMIEQPLWSDDFYFHAQLQKHLHTTICLDEAIRSRRHAEAAAEIGACGIVNIKVGRVGGFTEAIAVHDACKDCDIPVWCGGMLESGIGRAHNIALSSLENFRLPGDVSASKRYWKEDVIEPEVLVSARGEITLPVAAGRGFEVRTDRIEELTIRSTVIRPPIAFG